VIGTWLTLKEMPEKPFPDRSPWLAN